MIEHTWFIIFCCLFVYRYLRTIVHLIAYHFYTPAPVPANPTYHPADCSVIVPTVDPSNEDFGECLKSILDAQPGALFVTTVGSANLGKCRALCTSLAAIYPATRIIATSSAVANKRSQVASVVPQTTTPLIVLADDHVFWPSAHFLQAAIAPFEDARVGLVGVTKRVRRVRGPTLATSFWNLIGCLYLERHNFEILASSTVDGGVFTISGRTSVHRAAVLRDARFLAGFTREYFLAGRCGPLNADDDNFISRWNVNHGWRIRVQGGPHAVMETTLGEYPRFLSQALRWARTTFRSNTATLLTERVVYARHPWSAYAVFLAGLTNFALFIDGTLVVALLRSGWMADDHEDAGTRSSSRHYALVSLLLWILATKLNKLYPHFRRHPIDALFFPAYVLFAYYHSLLKLYAALTFWNCDWSGRKLEETETE